MNEIKASLNLQDYDDYSIYIDQEYVKMISLFEELTTIPSDHTAKAKSSRKDIIKLSVLCCRTVILSKKGNNTLTFMPFIIASDKRNICISIYDECLSYLKDNDKMYIPPAIEREIPTKERLRFLAIQLHNAEKARISSSGQQNRSINSLFGGKY